MVNTVKNQPNTVTDWFDLGNSHYVQQDFVAAAACYFEAIALRPKSAPAYNNLGSALQELGQWEEAIFCYTRALKLKPDWVEVEMSLAMTMHALHRLSVGEKTQYAELSHALGDRAQQAENFAAAATYFQQTLSLNPHHPKAIASLKTIEQRQDSSEQQNQQQSGISPLADADNAVDADIIKKLSGAVWGWAKTGFATVDDATQQQRLATCKRCPYFSNVPSSLWYRALTINNPNEKVCSLCGCIISKKILPVSESCPAPHPTRAGMTRWQEPIKD